MDKVLPVSKKVVISPLGVCHLERTAMTTSAITAFLKIKPDKEFAGVPSFHPVPALDSCFEQPARLRL